jgi:hypothetical protein
MASITALSVELQQMILEESIPESFEALSLTCRTLHEASRRYIPRYQRLKARFHAISYSDGKPPKPEDKRLFWKSLPGNPLAHLLQLARDPLALRFVHVADLEHRKPAARWYKPKHRLQVEDEFTDEVFAPVALTHLLERTLARTDFHTLYDYLLFVYEDDPPDGSLGCKINDFAPPTCSFDDINCWNAERSWPSDAESNDDSIVCDNLALWFETVVGELVRNVDYATTCLLALLPNVRSLNLRFTYSEHLNENEMYDDEPERMWTFLSAIASHANNPLKPSAGLSQLRSLSHSGGCMHQSAPARSYLPLFRIYTLNTVDLHALVLSEDRSWPNCPPIPVFSKNLKTLTLTECIIRQGDTWEGCLAALLSRMPALQTLRLHPRRLEDDERVFNVPNVIDVVTKYVGGSLETLSLSGSLQSGRCSGFVPGNTMMKGLKKLREVELDVRGFRPGGPWRFPSLLQLLPSSVENISLLLTGFNSKNPRQMCDTTVQVLDGLLEDFEERYETELPYLEELHLRGLLTDELLDRFDDLSESEVPVCFIWDTPVAEHMRFPPAWYVDE